MRNLRKFKDNEEYYKYLKGPDVEIPRVSYILNGHEEDIDPATGKDRNLLWDDWSSQKDTSTGLPKGGDGKRWVDYTKVGQHFIEFVDGNIRFNDIYDREHKEWYTADVDDNGTLIISTPNKSSYDPSTGTITIINYPDDIYSNIQSLEL